MYLVTKKYGHDVGLSATFRQWRAKDTHCRFLHGYALAVELTFACSDYQRDGRGWVINFGGLKEIKQWLCDMFDHKTLVATDDPALPLFREMAKIRQEKRDDELKTYWDEAGQFVQLVEVEAVGCEAFAKMIYDHVGDWVSRQPDLIERGVSLVKVTVSEHGANSATYFSRPPM